MSQKESNTNTRVWEQQEVASDYPSIVYPLKYALLATMNLLLYLAFSVDVSEGVSAMTITLISLLSSTGAM